MAKCPLCEGKNLSKIFEAQNAFVSVADLTNDSFDDTGGGNPYCKGDLMIELMQCLDCSYTFNALFDRQKNARGLF
ncbi:hypothetical protein [Campylobacter helveticus]|uniref:hypothetical protein n=1 Tax=Campylobacter helveticus TaxID=28898 RepID=UPI0022EB60C5|nr:hypothetical protein [Campylobacter helveticus]